MRVSYNWLQEYVDIKGVSPQELANRMTMCGVAVEHIDVLGAGIEQVVTGRIEGLVKHPDADKLQICQLNVGKGELLQIVTGASNVAVGQVVPVALVGAKLPSGMGIKKSKLRGVESYGMLCSGEELGIEKKLLPENQQEGILVLATDTPLGVDAKVVLGLNDVILELELTPNRADCLSMVGVAREVAAVLDSKFTPPAFDLVEEAEPIKGKAKVKIKDQELCSRYVAKLIKDVRIAPSPAWLQRRLQAAGVRPINNVVDVSNYVMLELGQPLHAFDYETLEAREIIVRRPAAGEELVSLDGQTRKLDEEMLIIADAKGPVAIAGVMGGLATEVTAKTKHILIESAYFNGSSIRRTSRRLGLRSEASSRFEKGIDLGGCLQAAERAAQLLKELAGGSICQGAIDCRTVEIQEAIINLSFSRLNLYMGANIPKKKVAAILKSLQFEVEEGAKTLVVKVPISRPDITLEEDLIEEVIRIYGYDKVPVTLPVEATTQGKKTTEQSLEELVKETMVSCGLTEVINLSFTSHQVMDTAQIAKDSSLRKAVVIQNPLSEEQGILRTTLLPGVLEVLRRNASRRVTDAAVYEVGRAFLPLEGAVLPNEPLMLAVGAMGYTEVNWGQIKIPYDFYFLKGVLETLLEKLGIQTYQFIPETSNPTFHPGRTAALKIGDQLVGLIGQVQPDVAENFELPLETCVLEMNLGLLMANANLQKAYKPLPKFPGVERDLAVVVAEAITAGKVREIIWANGGDLLQEVTLFDVFRGKQIEAGYKSLALAMKYQAQDRTLTDEEVNNLQVGIANALTREVGAELR
ncbi:MAG: phenylalanine--tRNA ligase subunit beta [Carboxydocellales bacterium]